MSDEITGPSVAEVEAIIALGDDVILRNLKITQCYHDLSRALATMLGEENVNWCTFATWASKAAGRFIRLRNLKADLRRRLDEAPAPVRWAMDRINRKLAQLGLRHASITGYVEAVVEENSGQIMAGNLKVFSELGPLFAAFVETFAGDTAFDADKLGRFLERLRPGPTEDDGQDGLRSAFTHGCRARFEADPKRKAEHLLAANALTGLHEQFRLQPQIEAAINAPVAEGFRALTDDLARALPGGMGNRLFKLFLAVARPFVAREVQRRWQEVVTLHLVELPLPDGILRLGRDVPVRPGQPPFPPALQTLDDEALRTLLTPYGAADDSLLGSRAKNWADLDERMGYILELFRTRQQDQGLFGPPFTEAQRAALAAGRIPEGEL